MADNILTSPGVVRATASPIVSQHVPECLKLSKVFKASFVSWALSVGLKNMFTIDMDV
jgi:hypothetical protein